MKQLAPGAKIAVIGAGVAGIVSSHLLSKRYAVTLYESESRLGGHTNTITITDGPDTGLRVDTGFIVLNDKNYPLFSKFLQQLGIPVRWSDMSFSYDCKRSNFSYAGTTLNGLFAQRANLYSKRFYSLLWEITRFCLEGQKLLRDPNSDNNLTLGTFLCQRRFSKFMQEVYLLPMGGAIWSVPLRQILEFPARNFLNFFSNHGLLSVTNRPRWQTVVGGSSAYVEQFQNQFKGNIRLSSAVVSVCEMSGTSEITTHDGDRKHFDAVVIATHADQSLKMLSDPSQQEKNLLGAWKYLPNRVVLHTDISQMPRNKRAWASWNYVRHYGMENKSSITVTYHMNRLQGLKAAKDYFVTLNPITKIMTKEVVDEFIYSHPIFDTSAMRSQEAFRELQGVKNRYYCGSYHGYGFHEDAVRSAVTVGKLLGVEL